MQRLTSCSGTSSMVMSISNCNERCGGLLTNYDKRVLPGLGVSITLHHVNGVIKTRPVNKKFSPFSHSLRFLAWIVFT